MKHDEEQFGSVTRLTEGTLRHALSAAARWKSVKRLLKCVLYAAALALLAHPLGQAIPGPFDPRRALPRLEMEQNGRIYAKLAIDKWKLRCRT